MTVTLSYDPVLSRIRIDATGLAAADYATIERSTDQISWTTIRGGSNATVAAGALVPTVDDYEFIDGVPNYYRVRGIEEGPIAFVAAGTASTANNNSVVPAHPAGLTVGDLKVILASIRNSGTGTVNVPAGWTLLRYLSGGGGATNAALLGRIHVSGDTAPTVTFASGAANADTIAQMAAIRRAALTPVTSTAGLNGSAQNIAYPALTVPEADLLILLAAWKADDATGVAPAAGFTEIGETSATAGDDALQEWGYQIQTTAADISAGSLVVTGGGAAISRAGLIALRHADFLNEQIEDITPVLDKVWLKSISRPFLNLPIDLSHVGPVTRPGRNGIFDVIGRSLPVAVSDVRSSRRYDLTVWTETTQAADNLDLLLASGDTLFLHAPAGSTLRSGVYSAVGDTTEQAFSDQDQTRVWTLPLVEVAAPSADIVGATSTWQSILNDFGTWADVLAAFPTWADVLEYVGDPGDVIVP